MEFEPKGNQKDVIVYEGKKPLLVEAGPGSGKTAVIVARIKHLIKKGVKPESFLVITFTKKAAENLRIRLKEDLDKADLDKMHISTIHSFCLDYLKEKDIALKLLDEETSERKSLFIQKYSERMGFSGESTLMGDQVDAVMDKFQDFTSFNVDVEGLAQYVMENKPVDQEYKDLISSRDYFPRRVVKDMNFNNDWRNARFLQAVYAYEEYLKLMDEHNYVDYNTLQLKTLHELENDPRTVYRTIFVDEFQDTDPLQYEIFSIMKDNCDYFTAVGDVDQHIYGFRSSFIDYFEKMQEECEVERISLNCNFRSTENIVNVTDTFIKDLRDENSLKQLESNNKEYDNLTFLLKSATPEDEARNIFNIIRHLKQTGKINEYGEVGVLYRKHSNPTIKELLEMFKKHNEMNPDDEIDFTIKGQSDLGEQDEIKSLIAMLWYITRKTDRGHIISSEEYEERNLKAFCGDYFEPAFWSLSDETKEYLRNLQDAFYDDIVQKRIDVRVEAGKKSQSITSHNAYNDNLEYLIKIFNRVTIPVVDITKVADEDREFFTRLEELREKVNSEEPPLIFDVFYELLQFGDLFNDIENNTSKLKNLAVVSQTIYNYSELMDETDVKGFFYFLTRVIGNYTSNSNDETGVQMMTVHSAKGLEFPVTIVTSLEEKEFPMPAKDPTRTKKAINRKDTFYTPLEYFEYKKFLLEKDEFKDMTWMEIEDRLNDEEELRVIYVAMTRAADLLILSSVNEVPHNIDDISDLLEPLNSLQDLDNVEIRKHFTNQEKEILKMNFSKYNLYNSCPLNYHMAYDIGFMVPPKDVTDLGTVFHNVMDEINQKLKRNEDIDDDELKKAISDVYSSLFDEKNPEEFDRIEKDILEYVHNSAVEYDVIDSELAFSVDRDDYILNGAVDLIYRISDNEIGILDYKNAEATDHKIRSYSRQLYTYASALKQLSEFEDENIVEAKIHFVKSGLESVEINDELIRKQEDDLDDVASKIIKEEYPKLSELHPDRQNYFCETCEFKMFCRPENKKL